MVAAALCIPQGNVAMVFRRVVRRRVLSGVDARDLQAGFRASGDWLAGGFLHSGHVGMVRMVFLVRVGIRRDGFVEFGHEIVWKTMGHSSLLGGHRRNRFRDFGEHLGTRGGELHSIQGSGDTIGKNPAKC